MAITAQELNVILSARDRQFTKAMDRAQKRVERFAIKSKKELSRTTADFGQLADAAKRFAPALAAAFSVSAINNMVSATAEIGDLANMAGVSTTRFQELAFASSNFGVQQDKLADILKRRERQVWRFRSDRCWTAGCICVEFTCQDWKT